MHTYLSRAANVRVGIVSLGRPRGDPGGSSGPGPNLGSYTTEP